MNNSSRFDHVTETVGESVLCSANMRNNKGRKRYFAPALEKQAHLRDITLGPSAGVGETFPVSYQPPPPVGPQNSGKDSSSGIFENDIFGG